MPRTLDASTAAESGDAFDMADVGGLSCRGAHVAIVGRENVAGHPLGEDICVHVAVGMTAHGVLLAVG